MSLLGLLTIGRTFGGVRTKPAPYRVSDRLLPDFGPGREHAATEAVPESPALPTEARAAVRRDKPEAPTLFDAAQRLAGSESPAPAQAEPRPLRRPRTRASRRLPVQGELSIAMVQVVRNDLADDDLELVPRRQAGLGRPAAPRSTDARVGWRGWLAHWRQWLRAARP